LATVALRSFWQKKLRNSLKTMQLYLFIN